MPTLQDKLNALKPQAETLAEPTIETTIGGQPVKVPASTEPEKSYHVFYHAIPSCRMVTETGRVLTFADFRHITDVEEDIEFLQKELANNNPFLSIKKGEEIMTSSQLDPMKALRAKIIAEYEAEQTTAAMARAAGQLPNGGSSEAQKLVPGSTSTSGVTAAGSVSQS
jgi:hypothetical protein